MTAIVDPRAAWLAERRSLITASDVAAILGVDERRGPLAVYASKVGDIEAEETLPMRRGRRYEALIAQEYGEQTDRKVEMWPPFEILRHPDIPWLACTPDATTIVEALRRTLQIKLAIGSPHHWKEGPPLAYEVQVQVEAACFGCDVAALAALTGPGPLETFDVARDARFIDAAIPQLEEFLSRVARRDPPEADGKDGTTEAVKRLWATEDGETIALEPDTLQIADNLEAARAAKAEIEHAIATYDNQLRARVGSASFGALTDGSLISLREVSRDGYTVGPTTYRPLKRIRPKVRRRRRA